MISLKSILSPNPNSETLSELKLNNEGFSFVSNGELIEVQWNKVTQIKSWKNDLLTTDEVMFSFTLSKAVEIHISEEQEGFNIIISEAEIKFPSIKNWHEKVINPAFQRNESILFKNT